MGSDDRAAAPYTPVRKHAAEEMNTTQFLIDIVTAGDRQAVSRIESLQNTLDKADRSAEALGARMRKSLGQAFRSLPGAEFITNPIVAMTAGIGVVSKLGMEAEKTSTAFRVLVGSESEAARMLADINKYADNTLWDRSTTQEAAKTMLGFGVSTQSVVEDLKMLGDVAMGDKNRLSQLALVFGQISSAGKLQGQDLLHLINAGYNPLLDISALTGKSVAQLKDDMSKGLITFDMVREAFKRATGEGGKFNRMTEQMADTSFGAFEQLKEKLLGSLLEIYNVIQPLLIPAITALGKLLDGLAAAARWVKDNMSAIVPVVAGLTAAIVAYNVVTGTSAVVTKGLVGVLQLLNVVMSLNPVGLIVARIAALVAVVTVCWQKFAGFRAVILTVWDTLKGFGNILKEFVIDRIQGLIEGLGQVANAFRLLFKGDFAGAWHAAKAGASGIVGIGSAATAAQSVRDLAGGVGANFAYRYMSESEKQKAKDSISDPQAAAGTGAAAGLGGAAGPGAGTSAKTTANQITTGGTRNTSIVLNIGKFFEDVNIMNTDGRNLRQLQDAVLESINRSLEIATSAGR